MTPATPPTPRDDQAPAAPAAPAAAAPDPEPLPPHEQPEPPITADLFSAGDQLATVAIAGLLADNNDLTAASELTRSQWRARLDAYLKSERP